MITQNANHEPSTRTMAQLGSVKKFYFLEYFYVLLKSVEKYPDRQEVFESFKTLKHKHRLGESKYRKLTSEDENLTKAQLDRYRYTFGLVIDEAKEYHLIEENPNDSFYLTEAGHRLLLEYEDKGSQTFNRTMFRLMEERYNAFRHLIDFLYKTNEHKSGLLIFPIYSPRQLGLERSTVKTTADIIRYSEVLYGKIEQEIQKFLGQKRELKEKNRELITRLTETTHLLSPNPQTQFDPGKYNVITKRFRDFWLTYFLNELYHYEHSSFSFDTWIYRAKQIGIIHATEFYPNFNGRVVYPTSVLVESTESKDFQELYAYPDGMKLYIHEPQGEKNQEKFVDYLVKAYSTLRRRNRNYFINLLALRELVCYHMRISAYLFDRFLEQTYKLGLAGKSRVRISLEVDKLPEETKAMYLKREPVIVDGKSRNIIAIDVMKGGENE
jgi:hypothetical protein